MIDFHTHLDLYPNALEILPKVNELNQFTLAVTTSPRAWIATSKVFSNYSNIRVALGLHPEIADAKRDETELFLDCIAKTKFIGEIGIDGSPRFARTVSLQESIFEQIIRTSARNGGKILSVHTRGATSKVLSILERFPAAGTVILHWFSGSVKELEKAIALGCWFSIGPSMINSNTGKLLSEKMPINRILPESDGPFSSRNNKPIMPWEAISITEELSRVWKVPKSEANDTICNNYWQFMEINNLV